MSKLVLILLMSVGFAAGAYAQGSSGITTSTDPARAAAVERQAQELRSQHVSAEVPAKHVAKHHAKHHATKHATRHTKHQVKHQAEHKPA